MHTLIQCGACRQQMRLPPSYVGKKVQCPTCGVRFTAQAEEELVDVQLAEEAEPAAVELADQPSAAEAGVLWVEPAEAEPERRAGPLRLRNPPPPIETPKPGRWPAYLFVLAALPLGLPLLAAATTLNRTPNPTASLLIWTGAAVVLTGLCLVIALPGRVAVGLRLAGSLTLSFVAYVVGGLIVLVGMGANEIAASEWRTVPSPEGQFSVSLPGVLTQHAHSGPTLDGVVVQGRRHQGTATNFNAVFCVDSFEAPANFRPDQFLLTCRNDLTREHRGDTILSERPVTANGAVGREFVLRRPPDGHALVRYLATPRRIYVLTIRSLRQPIGGKSRDRFFNSFIVLAPPPPPPQPDPPRPRPPRPGPPVVEPPGLDLGTPTGPIEAGGEVRALAFAPDGRTLAVAVEENGLAFWELATLRLKARATISVEVQTSVGYSPDGSRVAVGGGTGPVTLLDATTGTTIRTFEPWAGQPVAGFAFSPDGKRLAAASSSPDKPIVRVWELATGEGHDVLRFENAGPERMRYQGVAFTPDSRQLFVASYRSNPGRDPERVDGFYEVKPGKVARTLNAYRADNRVKARLSPDGKRLAYFTKDSTIRLWDVENDREAATLTGHTGTASEVAFAPDSATLASVSTDGTVKLWDVATGRERSNVSLRAWQQSTLGKLAFSADGRTLATAMGRKVLLWDASRVTGKP